MQMPDVKHSIRDPEADITFHVLAYRQLSDEEVMRCIRVYLQNRRKTPKLKRGMEITISTVIH